MKKTTNNEPVKTNDKKNQPKNNPRYYYTEADLGEDILNISLCSVYQSARQMVNNIYNRSYVFQQS